MAVLPGYQRQIGLPTSTNTRGLPSVQMVDPVATAIGNAGKVSGAISDDLLAKQATSEVTKATVNATLKLNKLEAELALEDGLVANEQFVIKSKDIYASAGKNITQPAAREAFDNKWAVLAGKSGIQVSTAGTARKYDALAADLTVSLEMYQKGVGPTGSPIDVDMATTGGLLAINDAVNTRVIKAEEGAKLAIKFTSGMAEYAVVGWLNGQTTSTMTSAFMQMDTEQFTDPTISKYWVQLGEKEKATLTSKAITNISRSLSFSDKQDKRVDDALKTDAMVLQLEYWRPDTTMERKGVILDALSRNKETNPATFNTMVQAHTGKTDRFDDPRVSTDLQLRILRTPHLVTNDEIINSGLSNVSDLLAMHNSKMDNRTKQAQNIIKQSPAFIAANMVEKRLNGDGLDYSQAEIWSTVYNEQINARDAGKPYDPVGRARELIEQFSGKNPGGAKAAAQHTLSTLGINNIDDVDKYFMKALQSGTRIPPAEQNKIRKLAQDAF